MRVFLFLWLAGWLAQVNAAPAQLPCRAAEHDAISAHVRQGLIDGGASSSLYVAGMPGKTRGTPAMGGDVHVSVMREEKALGEVYVRERERDDIAGMPGKTRGRPAMGESA